MSACGTESCGFKTAALNCGRCEGVFYCNAACQKADWKRHKPYCKPLAGSAAVSPQVLKRGTMSETKLDLALIDKRSKFRTNIHDRLTSITKELPRVLALIKMLLVQGARPDVIICTADYGSAYRGSLTLAFDSRSSGTEPLLAADLKPPVDPPTASETASNILYTPMYYAARRFRPSFVRLLVAHGADIKAPCQQLPHSFSGMAGDPPCFNNSRGSQAQRPGPGR